MFEQITLLIHYDITIYTFCRYLAFFSLFFGSFVDKNELRKNYLKSCRNSWRKVSIPSWGGDWAGI